MSGITPDQKTYRKFVIFKDGTKTKDREYLKGHFTYAEIKKGPWTDLDGSQREAIVYMRRWYLLVFPNLFSVRVHHIKLPDLDRWPHDHPWSFLSVILRGGYREQWCTPNTFHHSGNPEAKTASQHVSQRVWVAFFSRHVRRFSFHRNTDLHKIVEFDRGGECGAWTLIFTGPERREWGFMTDKGWVSRVALNLGASEPREPHGPEPD